MIITKLVIFTLMASTLQLSARQKPAEKRNILWIVSEDNNAYFTGCYGNSFATTPNINKLASDGFSYTHAYCTNADCATSRNTILTGVYSASNGHENMRSYYPKSVEVHTYMGDRWNGSGSPGSQYVFLPITITADGKMEVYWHNEWDLSFFTPENRRPARLNTSPKL